MPTKINPRLLLIGALLLCAIVGMARGWEAVAVAVIFFALGTAFGVLGSRSAGTPK